MRRVRAVHVRAVSGRTPHQNTAEAAEDGAPGRAPRGTMPARSLLSASSAVHQAAAVVAEQRPTVAHPSSASATLAIQPAWRTAAWPHGVASPSTRVQGRRAAVSILRRTLAPRASATAACAASWAASATTRAAAKRSATSRGAASSEGW
eukprot:scaffold4029_cov62-Phaeocystis_antarctica.AAC.4